MKPYKNLFRGYKADWLCMQTPKTSAELVDRLLALEKENRVLQRKLQWQNNKLQQIKSAAVSLLTRSRKQNNFTNRQVQDWGNQLLGIVNSSERPSDMKI